MIRLFFSLLFFLFASTSYAQERSLVAGMKLSKNTKLKKANYKLDAPAGPDQYLLIIEGDNIVVDFSGSVLQGSNKTKRPDEFFGIAIIIRNSKNVTVKNLN